MRESLASKGLYTAETAKKDIWMNIQRASSEIITIDRRYLAKVLKDLERSQYSKGYSDGYTHSWQTHYEKLPKDLDFEGYTEEW